MPDESELQRLGLYDPGWPDADERLRVLRKVFELGATREEVVEASAIAGLGDLALDLSVRPPGETYDLDQFVEMCGPDGQLVREMWQALGLPATGPVRVTPDMADGLRLLTAAAGLFTPETTLALARVVGSSTARMADALVSAFRVDVETPELGQGTPYSEALEQMVAVTRELLPLFLGAVDAAFRRHMVLVSYHLWDTDEDRAAVVHERAVGSPTWSGQPKPFAVAPCGRWPPWSASSRSSSGTW